MERFIINETRWSNMFAIKVNDKSWMPEYRMGPDHIGNVVTFRTEKKAQKVVDLIKKRHPHLNFKIVEVEEEIYMDSEKGILKQTIRSLN